MLICVRMMRYNAKVVTLGRLGRDEPLTLHKNKFFIRPSILTVRVFFTYIFLRKKNKKKLNSRLIRRSSVMFYLFLVLKIENFVCRILFLTLKIARKDIAFFSQFYHKITKKNLKIAVNGGHRHNITRIPDTEQQM